jgi:hypothetical protein
MLEIRPIRSRLFLRSMLGSVDIGLLLMAAWKAGESLFSSRGVGLLSDAIWISFAILLGTTVLSAAYRTFLKRLKKITVGQDKIIIGHDGKNKRIHHRRYSIDENKRINRSLGNRITGYYRIVTLDKQDLRVDGIIHSREELEGLFHAIGAYSLL